MFKESDGSISMRRVLAFLFTIAAIISAFIGIFIVPPNWYSFIPCGIFVLAALMLLFFTTWSDVKSIVEVVKK